MITGWVRHPPTLPGSGKSHAQPYPNPPRLQPDRLPHRMVRTISSSSLNANGTPSIGSEFSTGLFRRAASYNDDDKSMSTIPDPRSKATSHGDSHPQLSDEVAALSNKLILAINQQTNLDDSLSESRQQLDIARERVRQLEAEKNGYASKVSSGLLLPYADVLVERKRLLNSLADETRKRTTAEKDKAAIELELENLTTALFEEANKMVIIAREEGRRAFEESEHRNEQLRTQLDDTLTLLKSQQEQLASLKNVMEQMNEEKDDQASIAATHARPMTPVSKPVDSYEAAVASASSDPPEMEVAPSYPTSFTHVVQPVLRNDLAAYEDFTSLVRASKNTSNRVSSGSYAGLSLSMGLGNGGGRTSFVHHTASNSSNSSLGTAASMPATPTTPASASSNGSSVTASTPLKETRFFKRALAEDIEPTLRLDAAPGLSWLARRSVLVSMCEGTFLVDPMPAPQTSTQQLYLHTCTLCGESREEARYARTHRFRTNESDTAQRYPLCQYCLGRVRSSCDFLGFLRMLKGGHWRCDDEDAEKHAWEESVRLREQMFWARMGGGVVPVSSVQRPQAEDVPQRTSQEDEASQKVADEELMPRDVTPVPPEKTPFAGEALDNSEASSTLTKKERSIMSGVDAEEGSRESVQEDGVESAGKSDASLSEAKDAADGGAVAAEKSDDSKPAASRSSVLSRAERFEAKSARSSTQSLGPSKLKKREDASLSITIPGRE